MPTWLQSTVLPGSGVPSGNIIVTSNHVVPFGKTQVASSPSITMLDVISAIPVASKLTCTLSLQAMPLSSLQSVTIVGSFAAPESPG